jgi:hypothetical protein
LHLGREPSHSHELKRKYAFDDEHKAAENEMEWSNIDLETNKLQQVGENYCEDYLVNCVMLLNVTEDYTYPMEWSSVFQEW